MLPVRSKLLIEKDLVDLAADDYCQAGTGPRGFLVSDVLRQQIHATGGILVDAPHDFHPLGDLVGGRVGLSASLPMSNRSIWPSFRTNQSVRSSLMSSKITGAELSRGGSGTGFHSPHTRRGNSQGCNCRRPPSCRWG